MQAASTASLTPQQRHLLRRGALKEVQEEINRRLTRYCWTANSDPATVTETNPHGAIFTVHARKNVLDGLIPRCLVTPVITAEVDYRLEMVPEGLRRRDKIRTGDGGKTKYCAVEEFAGDVMNALLKEHGNRGDQKTNSGLVELAPGLLPFISDEEMAALRIDEVFFGTEREFEIEGFRMRELEIPLKNVDVATAIKKQMAALREGTHWITLDLEKRFINLLLEIGGNMLSGVAATQIWQDNVCRRANIALTSDASDEKYKPDYDELDRLCFVRTGNAMVTTATKTISDQTVAPQQAPAPAPAPVTDRLAEAMAMMAGVLTRIDTRLGSVEATLAGVAEEATQQVEEPVADVPAVEVPAANAPAAAPKQKNQHSKA